MTAGIRQVLRACTLTGALLVAVSHVAHAQQGSIAGTVTDQATGESSRRPGLPGRT